MITRRDFLKVSMASGAAAALASTLGRGQAFAAGTPNIAKFTNRLVHPIPRLTPDTIAYPGCDYYEISMSAGIHRFHNQLGPARTLRYGGMPYLGPTIEATRGRPAVVKFINNLPASNDDHPMALSIDPTVPDDMLYQDLAGGRATPHLHGGFTIPQFDGHPHSWFSPDGKKGSTYATLPGAAVNEAIYQYSNDQHAAPLWYHDHAMGITRLNVYAGLAGLYLIRDQVELSLNLPKGEYEVPLVVQDKQFLPTGELFYPTTSGVPYPYPHPIWVPEFFGDTPVVNAVAYPYLDVEPRRYRLRFYNGSQARFYNLKFAAAKNTNLAFWVIGMEQSLLPAPVKKTSFLLAPGERVDIIIDFAVLPKGTVVTLKNDAKAPYPGGGGGDVNQIMQFQVTKPLIGRDTTTPPANLVLPPISRLSPTPSAPMREIVMKENMDMATGIPIEVLLNGKMFNEMDEADNMIIDETPKVGDTEIWQFVNLTVDAHPMHMHLVQFQVYDRQPFNAAQFDADRMAGIARSVGNYVTGPAVLPPPEEMGWKDTVKSMPGEITRVIAKFDVPAGTALPAEYVYHCHILEHEENEMMRPFLVVP
jgi:spore coat protein A, manganese oxidase